MWPTLASTSNSGPRYPLIVRAFAGDSTMTSLRVLDTGPSFVWREDDCVLVGTVPAVPHGLRREAARLGPHPTVRATGGSSPLGVEETIEHEPPHAGQYVARDLRLSDVEQ